jgi:hypothetical protein
VIYEAEPASPIDYSGSCDYWAAFLAAIVRAYLRLEADEDDLCYALAAFIGSPACSEELRRILLCAD